MTPKGHEYQVTSVERGHFYVVVDGGGDEPTGFLHGSREDAEREIERLTGGSKRKRVAVRCHDGCGYKGYRMWPGPAKPCPRCGQPVDVGHPYRGAMMTKTGSVGGRAELIWGDWA